MKPLSKSISALIILSMIISVLNFGGVFAAGGETASEQAAPLRTSQDRWSTSQEALSARR